MRIRNLNPDHDIGASAWYLEMEGHRLLMDAGTHPKLEGHKSLPLYEEIKNEEVDAIAISHCHHDHVGSLPVAQRSNPAIYGAKHGAEVQYVFGTGDMDAGGMATSEKMVAYWAAFAKKGDPSSAGKPAWPKMDAKDETTMVFGADGAQAVKHFLKERIDWTLAGIGAGRRGRQP